MIEVLTRMFVTSAIMVAAAAREQQRSELPLSFPGKPFPLNIPTILHHALQQQRHDTPLTTATTRGIGYHHPVFPRVIRRGDGGNGRRLLQDDGDKDVTDEEDEEELPRCDAEDPSVVNFWDDDFNQALFEGESSLEPVCQCVTVENSNEVLIPLFLQIESMDPSNVTQELISELNAAYLAVISTEEYHCINSCEICFDGFDFCGIFETMETGSFAFDDLGLTLDNYMETLEKIDVDLDFLVDHSHITFEYVDAITYTTPPALNGTKLEFRLSLDSLRDVLMFSGLYNCTLTVTDPDGTAIDCSTCQVRMEEGVEQCIVADCINVIRTLGVVNDESIGSASTAQVDTCSRSSSVGLSNVRAEFRALQLIGNTASLSSLQVGQCYDDIVLPTATTMDDAPSPATTATMTGTPTTTTAPSSGGSSPKPSHFVTCSVIVHGLVISLLWFKNRSV